MANENQPGLPPQHMSSQTVPAGNQTTSAPAGGQSIEKQMLELARREKEVRKMQESLKGAVTVDSLKERAAKDRNGLLKELGLDDLIKHDENDPVAALKKQLEDIQNRERLKEQQAAEEREYLALKSQLSEKSDDYELVNKLGYENQVYEAIKAHRAEHGEMPDAYQIARQLEDTIYKQIESLKGSKKLSALFGEPKPATPSHPLDKNTTMTSADRPSSQPAPEVAPSASRYQTIQDLSKHIKFND